MLWRMQTGLQPSEYCKRGDNLLSSLEPYFRTTRSSSGSIREKGAVNGGVGPSCPPKPSLRESGRPNDAANSAALPAVSTRHGWLRDRVTMSRTSAAIAWQRSSWWRGRAAVRASSRGATWKPRSPAAAVDVLSRLLVMQFDEQRNAIPRQRHVLQRHIVGQGVAVVALFRPSPAERTLAETS